MVPKDGVPKLLALGHHGGMDLGMTEMLCRLEDHPQQKERVAVQELRRRIFAVLQRVACHGRWDF